MNGISVSAAPNALEERIKELNCLYGISNLFENQDVSLSWIMRRAVELIPAAWQYPDMACARIRIDSLEFTSRNFKKTRCRQNARIILNDQHVGDVDVYYTQTTPGGDERPFLEEEERLLRAISERLSKVLWLKRSEEALKESEERYRVLTEQVAEGVALVQDSRFYYVNPSFCRMFGISSANDIVGGLAHRPPAGKADEIARLYRSTTDGKVSTGKKIPSVKRTPAGERILSRERIPPDERTPSGEKIEEIHPLMRPDRPFWVQVCHSPIAFKGRPALLSTFKDISEIKEQQMAAQRMAAQLDSENKVLRSSLRERYRLGQILGRSPAMQTVYELILKAAAAEASVAVFGESGSGKELVAHAIHEHGNRKTGRFVAVNCGAIQESLFEREFFGHRKGAFSSAHADSPGYLDMADGGTLFLDEVSELTVNMQVKLLRAIEGGGYRRVGGTETLSSDFRIISASNAALADKIATGLMRADFFYRIQVIQIQLPPLRERQQDIPLLAEHFLRGMKAPAGIANIPGRIMDILTAYDWPGNVRELRNVLQRYVTLGHLEFLSPGSASGGDGDPPDAGLDLRAAARKLETALIQKALKRAGGNRTEAAKLLGISRRALFRKMADAP